MSDEPRFSHLLAVRTDDKTPTDPQSPTPRAYDRLAKEITALRDVVAPLQGIVHTCSNNVLEMYETMGQFTANFTLALDRNTRAIAELREQTEAKHETSQHDIQIVRGSIGDAVRRGMDEEELKRFNSQQAKAKQRLEIMTAVATVAGAGWPILAALGGLVWYILTHLK